ncbi:MAG TPA: Gfo/Idh/MocA family oxidoreductase [Pirellulaceae bacterium]|nr:Gfo/Idh/MocA family oxidoreductase [Pirellulaceae bacterium]
MLTPNRRTFLAQTAAATAAATLATAATAKAAANDTLTVALIGPGGMGSSHLETLLPRKDIRFAYVCDVDASRLAAAAKRVDTSGHGPVKAVKDMRTIFDDKSVDAVWIATPDHWHCPASILAVEAGKHVYVEKPVSHNIREGRLLLDAARKHKKVVQVGTQSRSTDYVIRAMEIIQSGQIGDVLVSKAWNSQQRGNIGHSQPTTPPDNLDYDLWLGPAPQRPYRANMLPGRWRWWYDFGVGDIGNDGVHDIDLARWGLGVTTQPSTIAALGSKFVFDDDQQFPDTQYCVFEWPGDGQVGSKRQLIFEQRIWSPYRQEGYENGAAFYGTKGMLLLGHTSGFQVFGPRNQPGEKGSGSVNLPAHHQDFIDCIKSGGRPSADIEEGHLSASLCHLANIACRHSRTLRFDPQKEQILGDEEANQLVRRQYREGHWAVPKGV